MSFQIRTVTVELLRAGPPHNQLLSPLTQYLGVCGEEGAEVVTLPYEHARFLRRLRELRYDDGGDDAARRLAILHDTGVDMANILASVPGVAGALTRGGGSMIHLRLVLSATELALLPFELAKVPSGSGGPADNWLALQTHSPVCITRHIRSVPTRGDRWPTKPRILFVAADPDFIPFEEHRRILRRALAPWLSSDDPVEEGNLARYGDGLTVIQNATLDDVRREVKSHSYSHVHVLAHGAPFEMEDDEGYGLALVDKEGGPDVVSGGRLAEALVALTPCGFRQPMVVTLAACDSGNPGSVITTGASFAHALHGAGIPLVIASQYPLSMPGSELVTRILYEGLLWGDNPWPLLHEVRRELYGELDQTYHDWASLVVYEALPIDVDAGLEELRYVQARRALKVAQERYRVAQSLVGDETYKGAYAQAVADWDRALDRLRKEGPYFLECVGLRASAHKQRAEDDFHRALGCEGEEQSSWLEASVQGLNGAFAAYRRAAHGFLMDQPEGAQRVASLHWVLVQMLSLGCVLGRGIDEGLWSTAHASANLHLDHDLPGERVWAHGSLTELWLLRLASLGLAEAERGAAIEAAEEHAAKIVELSPGKTSFPVASTRRQLRRYRDWWSQAKLVATLGKKGDDRERHWAAELGLLEGVERTLRALGD